VVKQAQRTRCAESPKKAAPELVRELHIRRIDMPMYISAEDCINCAACDDPCPNDAITEGDEAFVVNAELCTECEGYADEPECVEACPIDDCIQKLPNEAARATA
jgi:ferredoxin